MSNTSLITAYPSLAQLSDDFANLDSIGLWMIKKKISGKKSTSTLYTSYIYAHYHEVNQSIGAMKVPEPKDKITLWKRVKSEIHCLICTNDRKYTKERKKLFSSTKVLTQTSVITIASSIAKLVGVAVGVIAGAIAALLFAAFKIGIVIYCKLTSKS